MPDFEKLRAICREVRKMIIEASFNAGKNGAHIGGSLSLVEILVALYFCIIERDESNLETRDRVILSKAHASLALYCVLAKYGLIQQDFIKEFEQNGSLYTAHAKKDILSGLEFSGGSLGLGISYAVGVALALKEKGLHSHVYAILGDGECNEGSVWEALMLANHKKLSNLTVIVDRNQLQADGPTVEVLDTSSLAAKFEAFGFYTREVNGHSIESLYNAFSNRNIDLPNVIIADTVKGKGVSFMESKPQWHFSTLSVKRFEKAIKELEG